MKSADKPPSRHDLPGYKSNMRIRRKMVNNDLRWILYGAVPVVLGGLLLMGLGVVIPCYVTNIPDPLNICFEPDEITESPQPFENTTPPNEPTLPPEVTTPPVVVTTPPAVVTTLPPEVTTPPVVVTTPPIDIPIPPVGTTPPVIIITPTDPVDSQAVIEAMALAPQFEENFDVQIQPMLARGLDAVEIGGLEGQLAGLVAPALDEYQQYIDEENAVRQVMGMLSLNDSRLMLESMLILSKASIQNPPVPLGSYILACLPEREKDCIVISPDGQEFRLNPETVFQTDEDPSAPVPVASYEDGSIRKCFKIFRRKICIRVFR